MEINLVPGLCTESIPGHGGWMNSRCSRKATHDHGTKCAQHSAAGKAARAERRAANYQAWKAKSDREWAYVKFQSAAAKAIREIAAGHNDPQALAREVLALVAEYEQVQHNDRR